MITTGRAITVLLCCAVMVAIPVLIYTGVFHSLNQLEISGLAGLCVGCLMVACSAGTPDTPETDRYY